MRAILLAAGMGTRLRPLTLTTPKSLVEVNGKPMLERQIEFLKEKGIHDIIVVTGYLREKFEYLQQKYGVELVYNDKYEVYNNLYTMFLVKDYLPGAYVLEGDVYLNHNFLLENPNSSLYFSSKKLDFKNEWMLRFNQDERVVDIEIGDGRQEYILCGVSYWSQRDGQFIGNKIDEAMKEGNFANLYWDDIVKDNLNNLDVYIHKINSNDSFEIDSIEELNQVTSLLNEL